METEEPKSTTTLMSISREDFQAVLLSLIPMRAEEKEEREESLLGSTEKKDSTTSIIRKLIIMVKILI